jgi:membrane associated rhomboid family serine protease
VSDGPAPPACYLHPDRPAVLRCARCERPICGADAIDAPVGYQCTECARGGPPVQRLRDLRRDFPVTKMLVGIVAVVFVVTQIDQSRMFSMFGLVPVSVGDGDWWRVASGGFLHAGVMHVLFNGYLLWRLGEMIETVVGRARFAALFALGLAGGGLGVMVLAWATVATPLLRIPLLSTVLATSPVSVTVGASGAVFGLMGAAITGMRARGVSPWRTDIGTLVLLNLVLTFVIPGISVGGHVGGLLAGMLGGRLLFGRDDGAGAGLVGGIALVLYVAAVLVGGATLAAVRVLMG